MIAASSASQRRRAVAAMVSRTGWSSVGEPLITRRISLVAICCSSASFKALLSSAYESAGGPAVWRGPPHPKQNLAFDELIRWHRGHFMPGLPDGRAGEGSERWREIRSPTRCGQPTLDNALVLTERLAAVLTAPPVPRTGP